MKNIVLTGLIFYENIGDRAVFEITKELIMEMPELKNIEIRCGDLIGRIEGPDGKPYYPAESKQRYEKCLKTMSVEEACKYCRYLATRSMCKELIDNDTIALIFVGGGLVTFDYDDWHLYISEVINYANKHNVPIMMSGVGIEGYDENDEKCQNLKKYLNVPTMRCITTRDDIESLAKYCEKSTRIQTALVADSACMIDRIYPPKEKSSNQKIIGLGVIREDIFSRRGIPVSKEKMLELWSKIFNIIENKDGYTCKLFCNGTKLDESFGMDLMEYMNFTEEDKNKYWLKRPESVKEFVDELTSFDGAIVGRLHASIFSFSYDIPCIGLVWNVKQLLFGKITEHLKWFIEPDNFDAEYIVDQLFLAMKETPNNELKNKLCNDTKEYLYSFINESIRNQIGE